MIQNITKIQKKFDPNRFLGEKAADNRSKMLAFGMGPRSCIGYKYALVNMKIMLFHLLTKFKFKPYKKVSSSLEYSKNYFNIVPEAEFLLSFQTRCN